MAKKAIYKFVKNIFVFILCVAVCLTATPINLVQAEEMEEPVYNPMISVTSTSVKAGDYAYVYVQASEFQNIAGLEYSVYYDADVMSIEYTYDGYFLEGASKSIKTDTPGQIKCSILNIDGLNGGGELLSICFRVNSEATPGNYPISITVGSVYDTNLNSVTVGKSSGYLNVLESIDDAKTASFSSYVENSWVSKGDTVTYRLYGLDTYDLAAGNFIFTYDENLLEFVDLNLGSALQTEKAIFLVNSDIPGTIKVSYANIEAISQEYYTEYFNLTFQIIGATEQEAYTTIDFNTTSLIDENLGNLRADEQSCSLYIQPVQKANPVFKLVKNTSPCDSNKFKVDVVLSENANVAAGDFTINYNTYDVICTSVEVNSAVQSSGGLLIHNENIGNGTVKFSYATTNPFTTEQTLLTLEFQMVEGNYFYSTYMYPSGKNVVDAEYNQVTMEYQAYEYIAPININNYWGYLENQYFTYDGTAKEPVPYVGGLVKDVDFTVSYQNNINAGIGKVIVNGIGNYTGTMELEFYIYTADILMLEDEIVLSENEYEFDGTAKNPVVTINGLTENVDYIVSYENNIFVGTARVIITGIGNYAGVCEKSFNIVQASITNFKSQAKLSQNEYQYDGTAKYPEVSIDGLVQGMDYYVSYESNIEIGQAKAIVVGFGDYTGTFELPFNIVPINITNLDLSISLSQEIFEYDGTAKEPMVTIDGLKQNVDYIVSYVNNIEIGTATVKITGIGNYAGIIEKTFTITPIDIAGVKLDVTLSSDSFEYDGTAKEPAVTIVGLEQNVDYVVSYKNNISIGTATVVISGIGKYQGIYEVSFEILPIDITQLDLEIVLSENEFEYDGTAKEPSVSIVGFEENIDYVVTYENNISAGVASAVITGIGNYSGVIKKEFTILAPPYIIGDVNNDGRINVRDVIAVRKYIVDNNTEINLLAADADGNGRINVRDVIAIRKIIVGQ